MVNFRLSLPPSSGQFSVITPMQRPPKLFLYDVTSSYLEGTCNAFGAFGYNRDGKKGKQQIVVGLLADSEGVPVSVRVFDGNTQDVKTVGDQISALVKRFGVQEVIFVGDRGMFEATPA